MLDKLKDLGLNTQLLLVLPYPHQTWFVYSKKKERLTQAEAKIDLLHEYFEDGVLTESERLKLVVDEWTRAGTDIQTGVMAEFDTTGHMFMIYDSGARGNKSNFAQLLGMRGLMTNPSGETIEIPVKASFRRSIRIRILYFYPRCP